MLDSRRPATVTDSTPISANAASTASDVPPPPSSSTRRGWTPQLRKPPMTPSTSVFSANHPSSVRTRVFATPSARTRALQPSATAAAAAFPGMVTLKPTHSGPLPRTSGGRPSPSTSIGS